MFGLFRRRRASGARDEVLGLERDLRELRLELAQRDEDLRRVRGELSRTGESVDRRAEQLAREELLRVATAVGAPLTQLVTQAHLHGSGAAAVRLDDVLATGMRVVAALGENGVALVGAPGEDADFDPDRHDPLSAEAHPAAGQRVRVRVPGLSYRDTVVRKAGVDLAAEGC